MRRAPPTRSPTNTSSHNLELKVQTLKTSADWLTGEVEKQAALVRESDLKLAQYKETQDAGALDSSQNIVVARLTQNNDAATKARMDRIAEGRPVAADSGAPVMTSSRSRRC